jgi:hypothetical protein
MAENNNQLNIPSRNPFVALCEVASQNNWCWNLNCTTCSHGAFKVAFSKLVRGENPDNESFWPKGKENHSPLSEMSKYYEFTRDTHVLNQTDLASIVAEAKILDIQSVAKFPNWLGYIGLVLHHCYRTEAQKIISYSFLPQFIELMQKDTATCDYLKDKQSKQELLSIYDLDKIENSLITINQNKYLNN